ncbi:MAG TPA: glycoside hydrolase domain-containing protein, partial [Chloroflexota bacterium]|nr:glycoside hydrolase domain-containing protein [Chloroflexota bacterium]
MTRLRALLLIAATLVTLVPAPTHAAGSLSVWTQSIAYKVQPTTAPGSGTSATMEGAKGAYEAYQIIVHAGASALSGVQMMAGALSDGNGHSIAASNVTFFLETMINFTGVSAIDGSQPAPAQSPTHDGRVPDPLVPFIDPYTGNPAAAPFIVSANTNQPVWMDVAIPSTATAGVYTGAVTVSATGQSSVSVPVTLTVWNFSLPTMSTATAYFKMSVNGLLDYHGGTYTCSNPSVPSTCYFDPNKLKALQIMKRYEELAHDNRIDTGQQFIPPPINQNYNQCLPITDWTAYDAAMQPYMNGAYWRDGVPSTRLTVPFTPGGNWGVETCSQAQYTALAAQ